MIIELSEIPDLEMDTIVNKKYINVTLNAINISNFVCKTVFPLTHN